MPTKSPYTYTESHRQFCTTDRQHQFLNLAIAGHEPREIAEILGIDISNVSKMGQRIRHQAISHGYNPNASEYGLLNTPAEDLMVKGKSINYKQFYDKDGNEVGDPKPTHGWVKTDKTAAQMIADARVIIEEMSEEIPRVGIVPPKKSHLSTLSPDLLNLHILTDYHLGMVAWGEETHGDNWDTNIAEQFLVQWMNYAIAKAPPAKTGFLMQLGDFLHYDSLLAVTPAHRHVLDSDTRFRMMQRVAIRSLRHIINMMLAKYEHVVLVMVEGNHDEASAGWLTEMFAAFLENEPRITVITDPAPFSAWQHGNNMLAWSHGHKVNPTNIDKVIVGRFPEMYGQTKHRYAHLGHFHHRELKKDMAATQLMEVEMHTTMAAMDAHAANLGYGSARSAEVITYHSKTGEAGREKTTPELVMM